MEKRDFAFVCDRGITCGEIEDTIREGSPYVTSVRLFDVYEGLPLPKDKKSMAFSVVFTPQDEALTQSVMDAQTAEILRLLGERFSIVLRS